MKTALILGGTGAMGKYLTDILAQSGMWDVYVTSRAKHEEYCDNVHFIQGNARDESFITSVLEHRYDVIVDFMNYGYQEFLDRHALLLDRTDHYMFLSSARVYADSDDPITEEHPRLLDTTEDLEFLATQRYALRKARQEDMLKSSGKNNYTIVRPYITYSPARLQLGVYEKEQWLYRLLNDKPLVIRREILQKRTTLTSGQDVALGIFNLMGKSEAFGETVHIATEETMTWLEILKLYTDVLGKTANIYITESFPLVEQCFEGGYNTKYDRLFDRSFNSEKARKLCGITSFTSMREGLKAALTEFLNSYRQFLTLQYDYEALMDRMTKSDCPQTFSGAIENEEYSRFYNSDEFSEVDAYKYEQLVL